MIFEDSQGDIRYQHEDDLEDSTQGCEDADVKKHSIILHTGLPNQGATRSHSRTMLRKQKL